MKNQFRIDSLVEVIVGYNKDYRDGNPKISDKAYDIYLKELKELDPDNELFQQAIIEEVPDGERKQLLPINMRSLDKYQIWEEYQKWVEKHNLYEKYAIISAKLDGISFLEEIGKNLWTRGDGVSGQISNNHYSFVDKNYKNFWDIRYTWGEAMILRKDWPKIKEIFPEYKNPRNAVAGLFLKEELNEKYAEALLYVTLIRYGCSITNQNKISLLKSTQINVLKDYQQIEIPHLKIQFKDITKNLLDNLFEEWKKIFDIDGLVIDVDDIDFCVKVGNETNDNPAYAKAIKLNWEDIAETEITGIRFQVSKDGRLKPVSDIKPVILAGAEVTGPTLYNTNWIYEQGIIIGSKIIIKRSGDVIPKIIEVLDPCKNALYIANEIKGILFKQFPFLNESNFSEYIGWDENHTDLIFKQRISDWDIAELTFFFETMKLEEFGEPSIRALYNAGYQTLEDILFITKKGLLIIEGFGEKTADYLLEEFRKWKEEGVDFYRFAAATNSFKGLGETLLSKIDKKYFNPELKKEDTLELLKLDGFSDIRVGEFIKGLSEFNYAAYILPIKFKKDIEKTDEYKNINVVFTGFRNDEFKKWLINRGAIVNDSVSSKTTHLLCKELNTGTSKEEKAIQLGIEIVLLNNYIPYKNFIG